MPILHYRNRGSQKVESCTVPDVVAAPIRWYFGHDNEQLKSNESLAADFNVKFDWWQMQGDFVPTPPKNEIVIWQERNAVFSEDAMEQQAREIAEMEPLAGHTGL